MKAVMVRLSFLLGMAVIFSGEASGAEPSFPTVDELAPREKLADPFQFFGSDRRVKTRQDWEERCQEIRKLIEHYTCGPAFPQSYNAVVEREETSEVYGAKAIHHKVSLKVGPGHVIACGFEYVLPKGKNPKSMIVYICPRQEHVDETIPWREKIIDRGYGLAMVVPGQFNGYKENGPVKDAFPGIKGNTMMD